MRVELLTDPRAFLDAAGDHLAVDPVPSTVVATIAERAVRSGAPTPEGHWWAVVRDEHGGREEHGAVVGVAMRTAPFAPRPAYTLPMPDEGARLLARVLHERGDDLTQVNGALPAARVLLDELARLRGGEVVVRMHSRLFELTEVVAPRPVPGRLRAARLDEVDLVQRWYAAFHGDADEQAGRPRGDAAEGHVSREDVLERVEGGRTWLWEDADGRVVHLTGVNPPAYGVARIGPVYTPPAERGRGWASAAVAEVSQRVLDAGARPCLFTDQANPTSNAIYQAIGYRAVVDTVSLDLVPTPAESSPGTDEVGAAPRSDRGNP